MKNQTTPEAAAPTVGEPVNYTDLLSRLAQSDQPQEELIRLLSPEASVPAPSRAATPVPNVTQNAAQSVGIRTVFRLVGIVQASLQAEISRKTSALPPREVSLETPEAIRRALQEKSSAATLLCALQPKGESRIPVENWEATAWAMSLTELKQRAISRAAMIAEPIFNMVKGNPEEERAFEEGLKLFREASRNFEISLSAKNNIQAGPGKAAMTVRGIPPRGTEIIACLTQIAMECVSKSTPALEADQEKTLREFQRRCRRAFGMNSSALQSTEASQRQSQDNFRSLVDEDLLQTVPALNTVLKTYSEWKTPQDESINKSVSDITGALFRKVNLTPGTVQLLEEIQNQPANLTLEGEETFEKELLTIRSLEKLWNALEVKLSETSKEVTPAPEELEGKPLPLRVFAALRREAAGTGKASTMVLLQKILGSKEHVASFERLEKENPYATLAPFGFVRETVEIQQEAGRALQSVSEGPDSKNQLTELTEMALHLDYAEGLLYSNPVIRTITNQNRDQAIKTATNVLHAHGRPRGNTPMEKTLWEIHDRVGKTLGTIENQLDQSKEVLTNIPKALRQQESTEIVNTAIWRLCKTAQESEAELRAIVDLHKENPETTSRATANAAGLLLNLAEMTRNGEALNPEAFQAMQTALGGSRNAHPIQKILIGLCEGRTPTGEPIALDEVAQRISFKNLPASNSEMTEEEAHAKVASEIQRNRKGDRPFSSVKTPQLQDIARLTGSKEAQSALRGRYQNRFLKDISQIKRWQEKEKALPQNGKKPLTLALCNLPTTIKTACRTQIRQNMAACLQAPAWQDHSSAGAEAHEKNFGAIQQSYLVLRQSYKNLSSPTGAEKETLRKLQDLHAGIEEIQQIESAWVRAEKIAEALTPQTGKLAGIQTAVLDSILNLPKGSALTDPAIDYVQSTNNYLGNTKTILKEAILLPKELKQDERTNTAGYLATTIETHTKNLQELKDYLAAVLESPEALAETYLQHESNKSRATYAPKETAGDWEKSMDKALTLSQEKIDKVEEEIEGMTHIFETEIKNAKESKGEMGSDDILDPRVQRAFDSLIAQKEQKLQMLTLQHGRLRTLQKMGCELASTETPTLVPQKEKAEPAEITEGEMENTLARALDAALSSNKQKLVLPKKIEVNQEIGTGEILDASLAHKRLERAKETLESVAKTLRETNPKVQTILNRIQEENSNPLEICKELKEGLFEAIQACELFVKQNNNRGDMNPLLEGLKARMLSEDPELESKQRNWRTNLSSTAKKLEKTLLEDQIIILDVKPAKTRPGKQKPEPAVEPALGHENA